MIFPMLKSLAIFGAGGQGYTVADALESCGKRDFVFLDDREGWGGGSARLMQAHFLASYHVIVAIGDNKTRRRLCELIESRGGTLFSIQHKQAFVSDRALYGQGTSIHFGAHVGSNVIIGRGCIINTNASVGHDCKIGDYVNICDGAILGGGVKIGDDAFIGLNATILPRARIGQGAFIAAGAVVVDHVQDGERVAGNPAKPIHFKSTAGPLPMNCDASSDSPSAPSDCGAAASPTQSDPRLWSGHE
jgi:sugar O-acyltransferase (sialic acid O-acetyltransferase NeuD family)